MPQEIKNLKSFTNFSCFPAACAVEQLIYPFNPIKILWYCNHDVSEHAAGTLHASTTR